MLWRRITKQIQPKIDGRIMKELDALEECLMEIYPPDAALWLYHPWCLDITPHYRSAERYLWFESFVMAGEREGLISRHFATRVLLEARLRLCLGDHEIATDPTVRLKAHCKYAERLDNGD